MTRYPSSSPVLTPHIPVTPPLSTELASIATRAQHLFEAYVGSDDIEQTTVDTFTRSINAQGYMVDPGKVRSLRLYPPSPLFAGDSLEQRLEAADLTPTSQMPHPTNPGIFTTLQAWITAIARMRQLADYQGIPVDHVVSACMMEPDPLPIDWCKLAQDLVLPPTETWERATFAIDLLHPTTLTAADAIRRRRAILSRLSPLHLLNAMRALYADVEGYLALQKRFLADHADPAHRTWAPPFEAFTLFSGSSTYRIAPLCSVHDVTDAARTLQQPLSPVLALAERFAGIYPVAVRPMSACANMSLLFVRLDPQGVPDIVAEAGVGREREPYLATLMPGILERLTYGAHAYRDVVLEPSAGLHILFRSPQAIIDYREMMTPYWPATSAFWNDMQASKAGLAYCASLP